MPTGASTRARRRKGRDDAGANESTHDGGRAEAAAAAADPGGGDEAGASVECKHRCTERSGAATEACSRSSHTLLRKRSNRLSCRSRCMSTS